MYCNTLQRNKRGLLPIDYAATGEMKSILSTTAPLKDSGSSNQMNPVSLGTKASITMIFIFYAFFMLSYAKSFRKNTMDILLLNILISNHQKFITKRFFLLMHLSMLSPRVGGAGYPREID